MKKENIFLVDIYQIKGAQKQVYFNDFGCEAGALQTQQILLERSVPAVKMHNLYIPISLGIMLLLVVLFLSLRIIPNL